MKKYVILLLAVIFTVISCSKPKQEGPKTILAKLGLYTGDVTVQRNGQSLPVTLNMIIQQDDTITTGPKSSATLVFANIGISKIQEKSVILIKSLFTDKSSDQIRLNMNKGTVLSSLKKLVNTGSHFEVYTPTAVAGVRGTTFMVKIGPKNETRTSVFAGVVKIATPENLEKAVEVTEFKEVVVKEEMKEIEDVKVTSVTKVAFEELKSISDIPEIKDASIEDVKQEFAKVAEKAEEKREEILKYETIEKPKVIKTEPKDSGLKW